MLKIKKWLKILIIIIIIIIIIFFFPKSSGQGGSCMGCYNTACDCFGFEISQVYAGPWHSTCYGIPYGCYTSPMFGN